MSKKSDSLSDNTLSCAQKKKTSTVSKHSSQIKFITKIAILAAMAAILTLPSFEVPLWFAPNFYKLDFSSVVTLIGAFALGPFAGILLAILKNIIKLIIVGSQTGALGELADFIATVALVFPASVIYMNSKKIKNAVIGMFFGIAVMTVSMCLFNYFVLIPVYANLFQMPLDGIIAAGTQLNKHVTDLRSLIVFITAPFNLFKGVVCSTVTFFLYKKVSKILHV